MGKIKVFVIDDSPIYREIMKNIIESDPDLEYVGFAVNGAAAVKKLDLINPDIITLDIEMPEMNGIDTLKYIMKNNPKPVIMVSSFTRAGADITLQALEIGAVDYIQKPEDNELEYNLNFLRSVLLEKIKTFANFKFHKNKFKDIAKEDGFPVVGGLPSFDIPKVRNQTIDAICIGSSTGGTVALTEIIPRLRKDIGVPIFVVQHMPKMYTKSFAARLNSLSELEVVEGANNDRVEPNKVYIAPGGHQMKVVGGKIVVDDSDPENTHKPSVDVLFRSVKIEYKDKILAVILTGMGSDGAAGIAEIKDAGGFTVAQDEDSCVVFGMPGSAIKTGKVDRIIPLGKIANFINDSAEYLKGY